MSYRTVIIFISLSFLISLPAYAASIYEWMDENGVWHITDTPPPKRIKKYNEERYDKDSQEEINRYQLQQETKAAEAIKEADRIAKEGAERQRENRNREADQLEAEARKNIPGSQGMTASQKNMLENAARIRAGEEPIPYTPPNTPP
jgi:hypothetical protein